MGKFRSLGGQTSYQDGVALEIGFIGRLKLADKVSYVLRQVLVKFLTHNFEGKDKVSEQ
jgi:hypothetical protein